ncbi:F-box/kelch-repeat protein [Glycine soja]
MDRVIQPPLVDTTACLCRVDTGLKTVAGAKNNVPGTKFCLQPDINHPFTQLETKSAHGDRSRNQSPLLPGLPDDLAIAWLIQVTRSLGVAEEWIYVIKRDQDGKISWHAFDPVYHLWQPLPPVPKEYSGALGFGCAVLNGCHLYLFGGKDPLKGSMRRVIFYSARTNKWHCAPDMLRRRHFFSSCVINNCLYVAGGENEGVHRSLRSAEVYDPNKNRWSFISDMSTAMVPFIGVVYDGKWFLKGLGSHRQVLSEVYQPENDNRYPIYDGMVSGWRNPSCTLNEKLYALDCKDGCKIRVYDEVADSWSKHIDSKMHSGSSRALEDAALVPLNGKLCIIRNNMSISLVDVSKLEDLKGSSPEQLWETIAGKGQFKTLVTNLWSSLAGRNRLKSHIVHCQVLQI